MALKPHVFQLNLKDQHIVHQMYQTNTKLFQ